MIIKPGRDWRAILLVVGGGGSGLLALGAAGSVAAFAAYDAWRGQQTTSDAAQMGIGIALGGLVLIGGILIVAGYQALMAILGKTKPLITDRLLHVRTALVLVLVWLAASILAQAAIHAGGPTWLASPLHVLAIGSPVYLLARVATAGLRGGTRLRMWGALAAGLVCSTGAAALAEIALLIAGVVVAALFVVQNPNHLAAVESLVHDLSQATGAESALAVLRPILVHPVSLVAVLVAVSIVIPLVEEVAKSAAPWFIFRQLRTAGEGFWCGALSGAGFALFEGLMASADASGNWTLIFLIRGWSSLMHILASGLAGWGIAAFRVTGRRSRLVGGYAFSVGIHAIWNAAVVGIGYGGLRSAFGSAEPDVIAVAAIMAGGATLLTLAVVLPAAILLINRRLRISVGGLERQLIAGNGLTLTSPRQED